MSLSKFQGFHPRLLFKMYIDVLKTGTQLQIYKRKPIRLNNLKKQFLLFFIFFVWYQFFKGQISSEEAFESAPRNRIRRAVILKFEELLQCQFEDKQKRHEQTFKLSHSSIPNLDGNCLLICWSSYAKSSLLFYQAFWKPS